MFVVVRVRIGQLGVNGFVELTININMQSSWTVRNHICISPKNVRLSIMLMISF